MNYFFWNQITFDHWNNSHETVSFLHLLHSSFCSNSELYDTGTWHYCKLSKFYCTDFTSYGAMRLAQGQDASSHRPSRESGLLVVQKPGHVPGKISGSWPLCSPQAQPRILQVDNDPSQSRGDQDQQWTYWEKSNTSFNMFFKIIFLI